MFYVYTIVGPAIIILLHYLSVRQKPKNLESFVSFLLNATPNMFGYGFFLYYLEAEDFIHEGWTFYTVLFFTVPISLLCLLIRFVYYVKSKR